MKVTTTTNTKDLVKQIIIDGEIKRFTAEETLTAIHQRGIKCGLTRLKQLKKEIKQDARDWITNLAKERNEYIALYKQGIDTQSMSAGVMENIPRTRYKANCDNMIADFTHLSVREIQPFS
jgi:hypothetical protein